MRKRVWLAVTMAASLSACSTLPHDTKPQILQSYIPNVEEEPISGPKPGQEADLLLRDFYTAAAIPSGDYAAARQFLTPEVAQSWSPEDTVLIVDAVDIVTAASSSEASNPEERHFDVRGSVIGTLEEGGSFVPENGAYEAKVTMRKVDGQWRVADLPEGVVIERTELRNQYQPENLYFYDADSTTLIADRRWVFAGQKSLDTELITMLMQGPNSQLDAAVEGVLPDGATFAGAEDGHYRFTGFSTMEEQDRRRFAAELVWTLSNAGIAEPYRATADGAALVPDLEEMTTDDFAEFNPRTSTDTVASLYAVSNGNVLQVSANGAKPINNILGSSGRVQSAEINAAGMVAAVRNEGEGSQLVMGKIGGQVATSIKANTLSRPTFEHDSDTAWVVADGNRVVRLVPTESRVVESEVNTSALEKIEGEISVLSLSPSGARVAMIIGGRIFMGVVTRDDFGVRRIINVRELATELGGTALSLDWQPDSSLVVGTSTAEAPVWRLEMDGSSLSTLPSGNITAPVVSIAASNSTVYATDANAMLQLSPQDNDSMYWREVPGLQGLRSSPIVAN